jgi:hypothetical protein
MSEWLITKAIDQNIFNNRLNSLDKKTQRYLTCYAVAEKEFFISSMPDIPGSMFDDVINLVKQN